MHRDDVLDAAVGTSDPGLLDGELDDELALDADASDKGILRFLERNRYDGPTTDWSAIIGHDHAKRELRVVAAALERRDLAERLGVPLVKGLVVTGPPGVGKTLLARAFAGSVDRPVFVLSAADLGPGRIRRVYRALADVPCIVVIDEIDLIARRTYDRRDKRAVALSVALDGVVPAAGPITIALTSEPSEELDPSVVRAGRLGTTIILEGPDREERLALWRLYLRDLPMTGELDLDAVADRSQGMTGADVAECARTAAGLALADGLDSLDAVHLEEALDRRGVSRRPPRDAQRVRDSVAVHEAGHAVFAYIVFGPDALNSAVVAEMGRGAGHLSLRAEWGETHAIDGARWRDQVALSLAGLVAEELVFGTQQLTFGSKDDIGLATDLVLHAADNGLLADFGRVSPERMERGPDPESYELRGSDTMRSSLYRSVRAEIRRQEDRARRVLRSNERAVRAVAERLVAAHALTGAALIDALESSGVSRRDPGWRSR